MIQNSNEANLMHTNWCLQSNYQWKNELCNGPWYKKPESAMSTIIKLVKLNATLSQPHTINEEIMLRTQDFLTNETRKYQCSMQSGSAS